MGQYRDIELLQKISQRLKELRAEKGLSQEQVYFDTEVHIARIETGRTNISVSTVSQLCQYFGISIEEFFRGM